MLNKSPSAIPAAATGMAGLFGAITFTDVYQLMSFLVLVLTAVHLIIKIKKDKEL